MQVSPLHKSGSEGSVFDRSWFENGSKILPVAFGAKLSVNIFRNLKSVLI